MDDFNILRNVMSGLVNDNNLKLAGMATTQAMLLRLTMPSIIRI